MVWEISGLRVLAVPGEKLTIDQGDTVRVTISYNYKWLGAEPVTTTLQGFIGKRQPDGTFEAVADGEAQISLPPATEFTPMTSSVDIPTASGLFRRAAPPGLYDLFLKFKEYPEANVHLAQCIEIRERPGLMENIAALMAVGMMGMIIPTITEALKEE